MRSINISQEVYESQHNAPLIIFTNIRDVYHVTGSIIYGKTFKQDLFMEQIYTPVVFTKTFERNGIIKSNNKCFEMSYNSLLLALLVLSECFSASSSNMYIFGQ